MMPIPEMTAVDLAFSNDEHLPKYDDVPDAFKRHNNPYAKFISDWFFGGRTKEDIDRLVPKPGVDKDKALKAIIAVLKSYGPKHEHKEAGCAYMLSEWFHLEDESKHA
jgi:hypothetical protein